jgi:hypothetical protein
MPAAYTREPFNSYEKEKYTFVLSLLLLDFCILSKLTAIFVCYTFIDASPLEETDNFEF